jgi:ADP-heptose:LPS heptosyltransferase
MREIVTFEDQLNPVQRRLLRLWREIRWTLKGILGMRRSVLVEICWRLGDEIMALPIYEGLVRQYSKCDVYVGCHYPDLLIDNAYAKAVDKLSHAPDRYILLRSAPRTVLRIEHYARLAKLATPTTRPKVDYAQWPVPTNAEIPTGDGPLIAIASGASWETKRWPKARWQSLCAGLKGDGCRLVEMGNGDEAIGVGVDWVGKTSVRDAALLLHHVDLLVCGDSGLMHLALAVGTPVVALFGPTDPKILIANEPLLRTVTNERDCQGCWNLPQLMKEPGICPRNIDVCLDTVTVEKLMDVVRAALSVGG